MPYYLMYLTYLGVIFLLIFFERKDPVERFSWILFLVLVPGIGLLLYLIFGSELYSDIRKRRLINRYGKYLDRLQQIKKEDVHKKTNMDRIEKFNYSYCGSHPSSDNCVDILTTGKSKHKHLFEAIKEAKNHIHVLYFSIHNDSTGKQLIDLLCEKSQQGVEVRLLYDTIGAITSRSDIFITSIYKKLQRAGGEVVRVRPFLLDLNYRNHRKLVIIDAKKAYTGGMNVGDVYRHGTDKSPWRDTQIYVRGPAVDDLQQIFLTDWIIAHKKPPSDIVDNLDKYLQKSDEWGNHRMQVIASGMGNDYYNEDKIKLAYFNAICNANERIWIQTSHFSPTDSISQALKTAAAAGVDVRIMLPASYVWGHIIHKSICNYFLRTLIGNGARIFWYHGCLHAKTMLIDDHTTFIGSANMNLRSLKRDDELNVCINSKDFAVEYERIYRTDMQNCEEMNYEEFQKQGPTTRAFESIVSFLYPMV